MDEGDLPPTSTFTFVPTSVSIPEPSGGEAEVVLTSWAILILVTLLISTLFVSYLLERRRIRQIFVHETIVALGMGAAVGLVVRYIGDQTGGESLREMVSFDHRYFFNLILPPIILNSGYDLKRKSFFRNFGTILTFAFAGTLIASLVMGVLIYIVVLLHLTPVRLTFLDCMMFGSILSSTDPVTIIAIFNQLKVDPDLFAIVFGESLMNDAVAIVLFTTLSKFHGQEATVTSLLAGTVSFITVFSGSLLIGSIIALITSLTLKHTHLHKHPALESCIITLLAYSSYLLSNSIHLSGIVSLLFCAITLKHYAYDNMSLRTRRTTKYMFRVLSQLAENFVFIYLGVTLFANREQVFSLTLTFFTLIIVLFSRYASIRPLASLLNSLNPSKPLIPQNYQTILWWAGLRGAIAFALSFEMTSPSAAAMRTTTLVVCVMSVVGLGGTVGMALEVSKVKLGVVDNDGDESSEDEEDWDDEIAFHGSEGAYSRSNNTRRGRKDIHQSSNHSMTTRSMSEDAASRNSGFNTSSAFELRHQSSIQKQQHQQQQHQNHHQQHRRNISPIHSEDEETTIGSTSEPTESHWFIDFDNKWMKPLFTRRRVGTHNTRGIQPFNFYYNDEETVEMGLLQTNNRRREREQSKKGKTGAGKGVEENGGGTGLLSPNSDASATRATSVGKRSSKSRVSTPTHDSSSNGWRNVSGVAGFGAVPSLDERKKGNSLE